MVRAWQCRREGSWADTSIPVRTVWEFGPPLPMPKATNTAEDLTRMVG